MKTLEEKAHTYDEVLKQIKECTPDENGFITIYPQEIFSELKESEDERYKRILHSITNKISLHLCDIFTEEEYQCFDAWSNAWLKKQGEQKPVEWSEEDDLMMASIVYELEMKIDELEYLERAEKVYGKQIEWLKSFKIRFQPVQEWSQEDDYNLQCVIAKVTSDIQKGNVGRNQELIDWLKSLRPQNK